MLLEKIRDNRIERSTQGGGLGGRSMVDLFAGCGGLSLGFEHAGFVPVFVNELNHDARSTYLANRKHLIDGIPFNERRELHSADVTELDEERLTELKAHLTSLNIGLDFAKAQNLDVLAGGPPCQGYSGIGHRRAYSVDKADIPSNRLYERMAFVIEQLRPRVFLFENVKGLLSARWTSEGKKGEIWDDVYGRFKRLGSEHGYVVRWKLVYAKDYGVPQNRPRVLIVGFRKDFADKVAKHLNLDNGSEDAVLANMLPAYGETPPDLEEIFADLEDKNITQRLVSRDFSEGLVTHSYPRAASGKWQEYFRPGELSEAFAELEEQEVSKHSDKVVRKFQAMIASGGEIPEEFRTKKFAQRLLPRQWKNQGPTITACSLADDYVHYSQPRSLTVREWARLQTFPDTYKFLGKRTTGGIRRAGNPREGIFEREVPKYTQIGNAVPVKLAEAIGQHFDRLLDKAGY
ncbi:DNA cytosine methyltransferase [Qipengyuania sp. 1NDH17]|uniref:Cytosine-specific methyltransferase n=1 Tax=Qipengyuania polymorpha TaxID=2867234 RepID=A0ABS7IUB8_9SPHN|nr:DNA cytosine methyltransferase [Qipengyuania polymorpha]MBX7456763.1 DNA cytosine methyltransferase [Qipengyuania polymorpha]